MTFSGAQNEEKPSFQVYTSLYGFGYMYKTIPGFNDPLSCYDFSNGPFNIAVQCCSKTSETRTIKVSLYVPKKAFSDLFMPACLWAESLAYGYTGDNDKVVPNNLDLDDLDKIKEFTVDVTTKDQQEFQAPYNYQEYTNILWDGMTDPAFTNGKSYPVLDNVFLLATDAQTGILLEEKYFDSNQNPLSQYFMTRINRYHGEYAYSYTAKEHSVVCDIYFISQLPVKKAVPIIGDPCGWEWADWSTLRNGGVEKMALSYLRGVGSGRDGYNNWTESYPPNYDGDIISDGQINAYQVFDNLSPDENGVYHISWEIKDLQGNFFDVDNLYSGYNPFNMCIGLFVEGDGQETYNLGLPEYGEGLTDYTPIWSLNNYDIRTPPRPLKPNETVNYPEFDIENGVLYHYHGNGGTVVIPNSVKSIYDLAFYRHTEIQNIIIPSGVSKIGDYAFLGCNGLTSVVIPNTVTSIGDYAFASCIGLKSVTIPGSVSSIGDFAFEFCNKLSSVTCYAANPPSLPASPSWWVNMPYYTYWYTADVDLTSTTTRFWCVNISKCDLIVPKGRKAAYQAAEGWKDFNIQEGNFAGIESVTVTATVYISGDRLIVNSPVSETVSIYSINGMLLYSTTKPVGEKNVDTGNIMEKVWIVKGSSGWVKKLVK